MIGCLIDFILNFLIEAVIMCLIELPFKLLELLWRWVRKFF
ncbi:MAG TPA: hypothetical protein VG944_13235 [Fimbriimonas sp.]|nr:hypothetical protein [Fimbriimonas sp.]